MRQQALALSFPPELVEEAAEQSEGERLAHPRNRLNEMTGEEWLYFTKSVLTTSYPRILSHDLRRAHGANKPPQLMALLVEFFTKATGRVLDPFAGVGGTLLGASTAKSGPREAVGIEVSPEWANVYAEVLEENPGVAPQSMVVGDCRSVMDEWLRGGSVATNNGGSVRASDQEPFDFIVTDPPYNIHLKQTMSGRGGEAYADQHSNRRSDYNMRSAESGDLANLPDFETYLNAMGEVFERCLHLLRPTKYMAVIVRNAYQNGEYLFTHAELARQAKAVGFVPKGEIVWWQTGTRLRPYGYPYNYIPNISHQFIIVLQRPANSKHG